FRTAGSASYPLYVVHGLCGYWILNYCTEHLRSDIDLRLPVMLAMVALSMAYGNWVEPALIQLYRDNLTGAAIRIARLRKQRRRQAPATVGGGVPDAIANSPR